MVWVVKHKDKDRYLPGPWRSRSYAVSESEDEDGLVPLAFAKFYPTISGAKTARSCYLPPRRYESDRSATQSDLEVVEIDLSKLS